MRCNLLATATAACVIGISTFLHFATCQTGNLCRQ